MEYRQHWIHNPESLTEFFNQPKALQRLAFINHADIPSRAYWDVIVTDEYAVIESGCISAARGLHGIFPYRKIAFKWKYSPKSKRCQRLSTDNKCSVKRILSNTDRYEFVKLVPVEALSATVVKDILYGRITNPKDAIIAYGKKLGVKHLNKHMFELSCAFNMPMSVLCCVINPAQLETYVRMNGSIPRGSEFRDMIEQAYALEKTINLMWSPKRMSEEHTKWSRELMRLSIGTKSEEPIWSESVVETFRQCGLELCNTEQRVFEEGYLMQHCVYTNYWDRIKEKNYIALRIELEGGPVTIGLSRDYYTGQFTFNQAYHKYDRYLDSDESTIVQDAIHNTIVENLLEAMSYIPKDENDEESAIHPVRRRRRARREEIAEEELPW